MSDAAFNVAAMPADTIDRLARRYRAAYGDDALDRAQEDTNIAHAHGYRMRARFTDRVCGRLLREDVAAGLRGTMGERFAMRRFGGERDLLIPKIVDHIASKVPEFIEAITTIDGDRESAELYRQGIVRAWATFSNGNGSVTHAGENRITIDLTRAEFDALITRSRRRGK